MLRKFFLFLFVASLTWTFSGCGDEDTISGPGEPETEDPNDNASEEDGNDEDIDDEENPETAIAFPGAEGGGMYATGGRGGDVYVVNTLEDGLFEGTLRWAIGQSGPRIIVFAVSGTIYLDTELRISIGDVTIAGQSAPGDGITLAYYPVTVSADNVIIRFLRFRMGDVKAVEGDAIWGRHHKNIIIDHCSMSWSTDECASFYDNEDFTMQWCIIAESLNESVHGKGAHGYGGLWGGYNASFHHNLLAHHKSRNPRFYGVRDGIERERAEMVNNVIYNWGDNSAYGGEGGEYNIINNYYKPGPATGEHKDRIFEAYYEGTYGKFYVDGNYVHGSSTVTDDNWLGIDLKSGGVKFELAASQPFDVTPVEYTSAGEAYEEILEHGGASLNRDEVDERIVEEVFNTTATYGGAYGDKLGIIDTQETVGGWPVLEAGTAPDDADNDGMPDSWETEKGLDPNNSSDAAGNDLDDNYSNIEVYLNEIISEKTGFGT
ncbi:pectate lyase family protein [Anaerophaga thermohalophila]|uniref:pectate lyase family protein n=1 Tax=Anaerophaga thermohalophila TaxID=177400 RepID=UPI000237CBE9|nr:pectate lyase [Anaerophaga thermohalophila]